MVSDKDDANSQLLDFIIDITGASTILDKLYSLLEDDIREIDEIKYPLVQRLIQNGRNWITVTESYTGTNDPLR